MFWFGFLCGLATPFAVAFIVGAFWVARQDDPFDDMPDEHAEALGIGATHFGSGSK